jgi:hypothetical protein
MKAIKGVFVCDGSSDKMIIPILVWLMREHGCFPIELSRPNLGLLPNAPKDLAGRIKLAFAINTGDIVFVHRDAEAMNMATRHDEVEAALETISLPVPSVKVIPVRMSEAWLLIDEPAIRKVAQRPYGKTPINMPKVTQLESLANPKELLISLLLAASDLNGRRLHQFKTESRARIHQLAELITDFSPLRKLIAFQRLEQDLEMALERLE